MRILRTLQTFVPETDEPSRQALGLSRHLAEHGADSPLLTTYYSTDPHLPEKETIEGVPVRRLPVQMAMMGYGISLGAIGYLRRFDLVHAHGFRNFLTDCAFFLRS